MTSFVAFVAAIACQICYAASYSRGSLPPILEFVNGTAVTTMSQWPARQSEIADLLQTIFYGTMPSPPALIDGDILNTTTERGYEMTWVNASFAVPSPSEPCYAVFEVVRPTVCTALSPCPVSYMTKEHRRWNIIAATRGYVAVNGNTGDNGCGGNSECPPAVDPTHCFAVAYPDYTFQLIARRAFVSSRVLDYVLTLPFVRKDQVGVTGHSRNGKQSLIAAAFDPRFTAVADSSSGTGGISPYRFSGTDGQSERPSSGWPGPWLLPSIRAFDGHEDELPVDSHSVAGLIAPRHLLIASGTNDGVEPTFSVEAALEEAQAAYAFLGQPGNVQVIWRPGDHHGYEAISTYLDFYDKAFSHGSWGGGIKPPNFAKATAASGFVGSPFTVNGPLHSFNWSAWNAAQPQPFPIPPANATSLERLRWSLGIPPNGADGPVPEPGGVYPAAPGELTYTDVLQDHLNEVPPTASVTRLECALGGNIISGALFYRDDLYGRQPPHPAGWPAVVWLHGPDYNKGYEASYPTDTLGMPFALANASFVVLTYEQLGFGLRLEEGVPANFYARYPQWSKAGAMVFDAMSAVDLLSANQSGFHPAGSADALPRYPQVDPSRIYIAGYSLGGAVGLMTAAMDSRVAGVATVSGWTPLASDTDGRPSGGTRRWWNWHATQPRLGWYAQGSPAPVGSQSALPVEWTDVLGLVAPRPVFAHQPAQDRLNNASEVAAVVASMRAAGYTGLSVNMPQGVNALDSTARKAVVGWLQAQAGMESS